MYTDTYITQAACIHSQVVNLFICYLPMIYWSFFYYNVNEKQIFSHINSRRHINTDVIKTNV